MDKLLVKTQGDHVPGWMLIGMLQFDRRGKPAFMHRTIAKFDANGSAVPVELVTGPLPTW